MSARTSTAKPGAIRDACLATLAVAAVVVLGGSPATERVAEPAVAPLLVVVLPGADATALERLGLLEILTERRAGGPPWVLGEVAPVPGASGAALWSRAVSGLPGPPSESEERLVEHGVAVEGQWLAPPDARRDLELVARAVSRLDGPATAPTLLALSCSLAAEDPPARVCRAVLERAVAAAEATAERGGLGVLVLAPPAGFPERGSFFAIGSMVDPDARPRFRMMDVTATLLHLSGAALPMPMAGRTGYSWLDPGFLARHPVRWVGGGT